MIRTVIFFFAIFTLISCICSEILPYRTCQASPSEVCRVKNAAATNCQMAAGVCKIKRGDNVTIEIEFEPEFNAEKMVGRAFWANGFIDLPLMGMETNACVTTSCPTVQGQAQTYTYNLVISKNFPTGSYDVKWRLYNQDEDSEECCLIFKIKLLR